MMTLRYFLPLFVTLLLLLTAGDNTRAQSDPQPQDTTGSDSLSVRPLSRSTLDTTVSWHSRDSTILLLRQKKARLYGAAVLVKGSITLTAEYIEVDFNTSELYASMRYDSVAGAYVGDPVVLVDGAQEVTSTTLAYNFKTRQGTVSAAETKFDDGYFYMEKFKKVADNIQFGRNGYYTTCDAPHPHYYFTTPRMKVITGDRIFLDQVTLNVADVPILYLPVGIFFPSNKGRHSGLIIPRFGPRGNLGFGVEGLGYFWDINEYLDNTTTLDFYSKGGFTIHNASRFRWRGDQDLQWLGVIQQSDLRIDFGMRRDDPDEPLDNNLILNYSHAQRLGRTTDISGSFNYATRNAIRNTTTNVNPFDRLQDITTQTITSDLSYSTSWKWGGTMRASYSRAQNIITDALTTQFQTSVGLPTLTPFASPTGEGGLFENVALSAAMTFTRQDLRENPDSLFPGGFRTRDTRNGIRFNPGISIAPKLGYFTLSPSIGLSSGIFFRRLVKTPDPTGDTVLYNYIAGIYPTLSYNIGLSLSTKLFGIVQPGIFGLNALRHTFFPTIGYRYTPDFGRLGRYYDDAFNPRTNRVETYSIFETDQRVGFAPGRGTQNVFTIDIQNAFDAKIAQGDTLEDKEIKFLTLNLRTSFDATKDSVKWSDIQVNANSSLGALSLSANATLNLYVPDTLGNPTAKLLLDRGQWLPRVTVAGVSMSTSFSDQGFTAGVPIEQPRNDSGRARKARFDFEPIPFDEEEFHGERVRGVDEFRIPWSVSLNGSYNVSRATYTGTEFRTGELRYDFSLGAQFEFSPTPTTRINSSVSYNVREKEFVIPTISFYKDLHDWEMSFNWYPGSGFGSGFYFRLSLKAPQLRDLKLERTETFQ